MVSATNMSSVYWSLPLFLIGCSTSRCFVLAAWITTTTRTTTTTRIAIPYSATTKNHQPPATATTTAATGLKRRCNNQLSWRLLDTITGNDGIIISPFDDTVDRSSGSGGTTTATASYSPTDPVELNDGPLDLTWENVEMVLDEMRPYLIQDGGNVAIADIDGPVVRLQLEGACGTCPSSTQTMKMGLERRLRERIPEIQDVIQAMPAGPPLNDDQVNIVLDGVRPFLQVAGGSIDIHKMEGIDGLQPTIWLHMKGTSATLNSVKLEIAQRLQRHFMLAGLRVEWVL